MTAGTDLIKFIKDSGNFFRTNQFRVRINPPQGLGSSEEVSISCKKAAIPGFSIGTQQVSTGGEQQREIASELIFPDLDFIFYLSADFKVKDFFDEWRGLIIDTPSGRLGYYDDYKTDIIVEALSQNDRVLKTYTLIDAYPKTVGDIDLDFDADNSLGTVAVSMYYNRYN